MLLLAGCPGPSVTCGVGDAPADGLTGTGGGGTVTYGQLAAGANNDCPGPGIPGGVISVTVHGRQVAPAGNAVISFCLPRPDLIVDGDDVAVVAEQQPALAGDRVQVVDVGGAPDADCTWSIAGAPTGTARFDGFCADGTDAAGFALTLDATVPVTKTCTALPDVSIDVAISGSVAVTPE